MKRFTQCVCVILVLAAILTIPAFAAEAIGERASAYFFKYSAYIYRVSSTKFEVWFDITAVDTMDKLGAKEIKVQRSSNGDYWTTMATYDMDDYSQMIDDNTIQHDECVSYNYLSGYQYRAVVVFYAKKSSSYGELTVTTQTFES